MGLHLHCLKTWQLPMFPPNFTTQRTSQNSGVGAPGPIPARGWYFSYELQISHHPGRHISSIWTNHVSEMERLRLSRVGWSPVCLPRSFFRENWMEMISNSPKNMSITLRALESGGFCDVALTLFWFPWATACCNLAACCSNSIELWYWITRYDLST